MASRAGVHVSFGYCGLLISARSAPVRECRLWQGIVELVRIQPSAPFHRPSAILITDEINDRLRVMPQTTRYTSERIA